MFKTIIDKTQQRLQEAKNCIDGYDRTREHKTHNGVYEGDVISFLEGGGQRRAHEHVMSTMTAKLCDPDAFPIESYTNYDVFPELYKAVKQQFTDCGVHDSSVENIAFANGSIQLFNSFVWSTCATGDLMITGKSFYHAFTPPPYNRGGGLVSVETKKENDYKLTAQDLQNWYQENPDLHPKVLLISNPTPIGAIYTWSELRELAAVIQEKGLYVYVDAVFKGAEYHKDKKYPSLAAMPRMEDHVVMASSPSKTHGCANLRIGWACGPKQIIDGMIQYTVDNVTTICQLNQIGAAAALKTPSSYMIENGKEAQRRAQLIAKLVQSGHQHLDKFYHSPTGKPFIAIEVQPQSGYSVLLNFDGLKGLHLPDGKTIQGDLDITRYFLTHGVAFSPSSSTGFENSCCVRMAFAEIGQHYARQATQKYELQENLKALLHAANPTKADEVWQTVSDTLDLKETLEDKDQNVQIAYEKAGTLITEVFQNRIMTGIEKLLTSNGLCKKESTIITEKQESWG